MKSPCVDVSIPETNLCSHLLQHFPKYGKKVALIDSVQEGSIHTMKYRSQLLIWHLV